jgi:hypothetical protein
MNPLPPPTLSEEELKIALIIEEQKEAAKKKEWLPEFLYIESDPYGGVPSTDDDPPTDVDSDRGVVEIQL